MLKSVLLACITLALTAKIAVAADGQVFNTNDVDRFYKLYEATGGHPTAEQLQKYIDEGSSDLRKFAQMRKTTGARIAEAMEKQPAIYADARRCMATLPNVRRRVGIALWKFAGI